MTNGMWLDYNQTENAMSKKPVQDSKPVDLMPITNAQIIQGIKSAFEQAASLMTLGKSRGLEVSAGLGPMAGEDQSIIKVVNFTAKLDVTNA